MLHEQRAEQREEIEDRNAEQQMGVAQVAPGVIIACPAVVKILTPGKISCCEQSERVT